MEPIMCPFCGGSDLVEEETTDMETEEEFWVIYHWTCLSCNESFDKIVISDIEEEEDFEKDTGEDEDTIWS